MLIAYSALHSKLTLFDLRFLAKTNKESASWVAAASQTVGDCKGGDVKSQPLTP